LPPKEGCGPAFGRSQDVCFIREKRSSMKKKRKLKNSIQIVLNSDLSSSTYKGNISLYVNYLVVKKDGSNSS